MDEALYFDGASAKAAAVSVEFAPKTLNIFDETGLRAAWAYGAIRQADDDEPPTRFKATPDSGARLVLTNEALRDELRTRAPRAFHNRNPIQTVLMPALGFAVASLALLAGLYAAAPIFAESAIVFVPPRAERAIGDDAMGQISIIWPPCRDELSTSGEAALMELTDRLGAGREIPFDVTVTIVNSRIINAAALPGGHIVVTRGLLEFVEHPNELAGILAHEMGHVIERHSMKHLLRDLGVGLPLDLALGGGLNSARVLYSLGSQLANLSYSRADERAADELALDLLANAGLSSAGLAHFFERLDDVNDRPEADKNGALPDILRSHPRTQTRARLARNAALSDDAVRAFSDDAWITLKQACAASETPPLGRAIEEALQRRTASPDAKAED